MDYDWIPDLCADVQGIVRRAKERQTAWLADQGLTMEQARKLPQEKQDTLQAAWLAYLKGSFPSYVPTRVGEGK